MAAGLYARLRTLCRWRRKHAELDDEIRFHLSEDVDEQLANGVSPVDARQAAARAFGNVTLVREGTRDAWGWAGAERWLQDVRYALRMMRRDPGFSAVAILTLALGIGATTAILAVVSALLVRPLPFADADRLVILFATTPTRGIYRDTTSFLDFSAWQRDSRALASAAAYRRDPFVIGGEGPAEPALGLSASHELLDVLGVRPALGRAFTREEQRAANAVALISHALWIRRYGGDPGILERSILINGLSHSIVGVLPPEFQFPAYQSADLIVPVPERTCRSCGYIRGVARLGPNVALGDAQRQLSAIAAGLERTFPESNRDRGVAVVPLREVAVGSVRTPLFVLLGAGLCVLLIGASNVGNLVLGRVIARQRELAVRSALGAGHGRLTRQLLTESLCLALAGALIGLVLAGLGRDVLVASLSQRIPLPPVRLTSADLGLALAVAILAGILSGLVSTLTIWKTHPLDSLNHTSRGSSGGLTQHRLRSLLVISQTALTVTLLLGAGLLLRSFAKLQQVDVGLNARHALAADVMLSTRNAQPARRQVLVRQLLETMGAIPGVQAAAIHVDSPFQGGGKRETFTIEGLADPGPQQGHPTNFNIVNGDFFRAMDIPVVRGRAFDGQDTAGSPPVAIVNETMAQRFWPGEDAVGKRLRFYYDTSGRWLSVVGVVRDVRYHGRLVDPAAQLFVTGEQPFYKVPGPTLSIVVRTAGDPAGLTSAVQAGVWAVDKDLALLSLKPMAGILAEEVSAPRIYTILLSSFAAIALIIAAAGLYATTAYAVVRQTREIGIRLAIGATPSQILRRTLRNGAVLSTIGVGLGIAATLALTTVISGFLYGITPTDLPTFAAALLLFALVAFFSTYIPARRASRIDPTVAFRYE